MLEFVSLPSLYPFRNAHGNFPLIYRASIDTYSRYAPRIRPLAWLLAAIHVFFWLLNNFSGESESTHLRIIALGAALLLTIDTKKVSNKLGLWIQRATLPAIVISGPAFLLSGLLLEINQTTPDSQIIFRRQYEFVAALGMVLLISTDILAAAILIASSSIVVVLVGAFIYCIDLSILTQFWAVLASSYALLFYWAILVMTKKRQELDNKTSALNTVGTSIAHEIRTPLLSIKARATRILQVSQQSDSIDEMCDASNAIVREVDAASTLIDMFLLNASPHPPTANNEAFSLNELIHEAKQRFPYKSKKNLDAVNIELDHDVTISGPRELLLHVFFNLLKNAFEHAFSDDTQIVISTNAKDSIRIMVEDNGIGISPEVLENVFQPFYSTSKNYGTGIGLAFCKDTVENHFAGSIKIDAGPERFTRVLIVLPRGTH